MEKRGWITVSTVLALLALPLAATAGPAAKSKPHGAVNHVVFTWMADGHKSPQDIQRLIDGEQMLRKIPGLLSMRIGTPVPSTRPNEDASYDIASYFRFRSIEAMHEYLKNPIHVKFLNEYAKGNVKKILIYDFQEP